MDDSLHRTEFTPRAQVREAVRPGSPRRGEEPRDGEGQGRDDAALRDRHVPRRLFGIRLLLS